jgi:16S rRNA (adenine1518-N6/adenine1519-N6)-dimethyltransferase
VDDIGRLQLVVQTAFNQRRKTIGNSLGKLMQKSALDALGIDPRLRAENLSLEQFSLISNLKETA